MALSGFALFALHIIISLLFSFSEISVPPVGKQIIFRYMFPLFNQNFRVFAPDPPFYHSVMELRVWDEGKRAGPWINPAESTLKEFQQIRLTPAYTDYRVYEYHLRLLYDAWLLNDYRANKAMGDSINAGKNEMLRDSLLRKEAMLNYVAAYCLNTGNKALEKGQKVELRIRQIYAQTPDKFRSQKTEPAQLALRFPAITIP